MLRLIAENLMILHDHIVSPRFVCGLCSRQFPVRSAPSSRFVRSGFYNTLGGGLRTFVALITLPLLARIIGADTEEYGVWTLVLAIVNIVALAEGGLSFSTTFFLSKDLAGDNRTAISQTISIAAVFVFVLATVAALVLAFGAHLFVSLLPPLSQAQHAIAVSALQVAALVIWTRLLLNWFLGIEQALEWYGRMNILLTVQAVLTNVGMLTLAAHGGRTLAFMQWQAAIGLVTLVPHIYIVGSFIRRKKLTPQWSSNRRSEMVRYSGLNWLSLLASTAFSQCDRLIVGAIVSTKVVGVYGVITTIAAQINVISSFPVQPLLPTLGKLLEKRDATRISEVVKSALQTNASIALGLSVGVFSFAPLLAKLILKEANPTYVSMFQLAAIIYGVYSVNAVGYHVLLATKQLKDLLSVQLTAATISLLLIALGTAKAGLSGAIWGNIGYWAVTFLTLFGMRNLEIDSRTWTRWMLFPFVWFIAVIMINHFLTPFPWLMGGACILELAVLGGWLLLRLQNRFTLLAKIIS